MKISLNWLKDFVDIPSKYSPKELAELLTLRTCEVEGFEDEKMKFAGMVVGKVAALRPHPNADKLKLADTDIGGKTVQIVCGGMNLAQGMTVAVALPGAKVKWHGQGELVELKETKIRGEHSFGMICAGEEIGLPPAPPEGITDLSVLWQQMGLKSSKQGTPLAKALGLEDLVFEIDNKSLTHRPDLWGHYGLAREFSAFLPAKLKPFAPKVVFPKIGQRMKVEIAKSEIAARFLSGTITGICIEESPQWLKNRLIAVGLRPVNNIVDVTNYVMLETGYPMHAFDRRTVGTDHFVIRYAKPGEMIMAIDHKTYALTPEDALVTNGERALAIAGIMGGAGSEIKPSTTEIILEVGNWNPIMIRKTAQRHGLRTDAAQRFEKSLDPVMAEQTFERACELILEICKDAKLAGPMTDVYLKKPKPISVTVETETVNRKIGARITEKEMAIHLKALGFTVGTAKKGFLKIGVPTWRATKDINIEDDIVEEIARMHGYEKIAPVLPTLPIKLPIENRERALKHKARQIFSLALGFSETMHYSFYGIPEIRKALLPENLHVLLENPLTEDQTHMRISLLPNLLKTVAVNLNSREKVKLYEIGRTYIKGAEYFPQEEKFICGVVARNVMVRKPHHDTEIFHEALGTLQSFLDTFGVKTREETAETVPPYSHPSKCAAMMVQPFGGLTAGGAHHDTAPEIAVVYEVHPAVLKNFGITAQVAAFEINFTRLAALNRNETLYKPLPRFPGIEIDISVLVPKRTPVRGILELIKHSDQKLISNISLIDTFEGKNLGEDKKSFTFRVLLQSPDRTLTDSEMKQVQERIFKNLQHNNFAIRGL